MRHICTLSSHFMCFLWQYNFRWTSLMKKKSPWISLLLDSNCDPAKSGGRRLVVNKYLFPPCSRWKSDKFDYVSVIYRYGPDITNKILTRRDGPGLRRLSEAAFRSRKQTGKNYYTLYLSLFKKKKLEKVLSITI